jgi:hypothetical protein
VRPETRVGWVETQRSGSADAGRAASRGAMPIAGSRPSLREAKGRAPRIRGYTRPDFTKGSKRM